MFYKKMSPGGQQLEAILEGKMINAGQLAVTGINLLQNHQTYK